MSPTLPAAAGKLYEYVAAGRAVLVFGDGGEAAALVRQLGTGRIVASGDPAGLEGAVALKEFLEGKMGKQPDSPPARRVQRR